MILFEMEDHPVPQNITTFEFHLVGDMTLKQFAYLASGLAVAYVLFLVLLPVSPILAVPLIAFSALVGAAFAFVPIFDRPLDHWLKAYLKAIYSPTQATWKYLDITADNDQANLLKHRLSNYLATLPQSATPVLPKLTRLNSPTPKTVPLPPQPEILNNVPLPILPPIPIVKLAAANIPAAHPAPPVNTDFQRAIEMSKEMADTKAKLAEAEKKINLLQTSLGQEEALLQRFKMASQPVSAQKLTTVPIPLITPIKPSENIPAAAIPKIKVVEEIRHPKTQLVLTSLPNVINGVITDTSGNYLESVIVIIHSAEGLPVRALKTNKLGQFAGATSLPSGTYTITMEKDNLEFDTLQLTLSGQIIAPIKISAKKKGVVNI